MTLNAAEVQWQSINSGEPLPPYAILAGKTKGDGVVYVGCYEGEAGKINTQDGREGSNMCNFWGRNTGKQTSVKILCCARPGEWRPVKRGDPIPPGAVKAGETKADGATYVARSGPDGECGKINTDGGKVWNFWGRDFGGSESGELLVFDLWVPLKTGEDIPGNAVKAGETDRDGPVWVGRHDGFAGKVNANDFKMHKFYAHGDGGGKHEAEILCCSEEFKQEWIAIERGVEIPANAVKAGETPKDGVVYVGRHKGEAGKINCDGGAMHNFWGNDTGDKKSAEILVISDLQA